MEEKCLLIVCVAVVLCVSSCSGMVAYNKYQDIEAAKEMQKNGADVLDIRCAIGEGTERYCELRAATKAMQK